MGPDEKFYSYLTETEEKRLSDVDLGCLLQLSERALHNFNEMKNEDLSISVLQIVIVGSILRTRFEPGKSDLDFYLIVNDEYEYRHEFLEHMRRSNDGYFRTCLHEDIAKGDILDVVSKEEKSRKIRSPKLEYPMEQS